jgi:Tol biopolymer transport system component
MIAFNRADGGNSSLFVMRLDGTGLRQITTSPSIATGDAVDFRPNWSPQGNRIVFLHASEQDNEIYAVRSNGEGLTRLTNTPERIELTPVWSPDGSQIAFNARATSAGPGGEQTIYVMNSDGSGIHAITGNGGELDWQALLGSDDGGSGGGDN